MSSDRPASREQRRWRIAAGLVAAALAWGVALVAGAATIPLGTAEECVSGPAGTTCRTVEQTPLESEGISALLVAAVPAVVSAVAALALLRARSRPTGRGLRIATVCAGALGLLALAGAASVGVLVAPAAVALLVAVVLAGTRPTDAASLPPST